MAVMAGDSGTARRDLSVLGSEMTSRFPTRPSVAATLSKLSVEYRRARDLSDLGVLKLSQIIGSDQEWQVPFMGCSLVIHDVEATVEGYVMVANGFRPYMHPRFIVDGDTVEVEHCSVDEED
jgi:hypothetical protein